MTTLTIPIAIIFTFTLSAPGVQSITTSRPIASMDECRTAEGIVKLMAYFDPETTVRTACRERK